MKQSMVLPTKEELEAMAAIDIRLVDPEELVDIKDVVIDPELPVAERVAQYISQVKNPYCYKSNGVTVKISFAGNERLEDCLARCISLE